MYANWPRLDVLADFIIIEDMGRFVDAVEATNSIRVEKKVQFIGTKGRKKNDNKQNKVSNMNNNLLQILNDALARTFYPKQSDLPIVATGVPGDHGCDMDVNRWRMVRLDLRRKPVQEASRVKMTAARRGKKRRSGGEAVGMRGLFEAVRREAAMTPSSAA